MQAARSGRADLLVAVDEHGEQAVVARCSSALQHRHRVHRQRHAALVVGDAEAVGAIALDAERLPRRRAALVHRVHVREQQDAAGAGAAEARHDGLARLRRRVLEPGHVGRRRHDLHLAAERPQPAGDERRERGRAPRRRGCRTRSRRGPQRGEIGAPAPAARAPAAGPRSARSTATTPPARRAAATAGETGHDRLLPLRSPHGAQRLSTRCAGIVGGLHGAQPAARPRTASDRTARRCSRPRCARDDRRSTTPSAGSASPTRPARSAAAEAEVGPAAGGGVARRVLDRRLDAEHRALRLAAGVDRHVALAAAQLEDEHRAVGPAARLEERAVRLPVDEDVVEDGRPAVDPGGGAAACCASGA